MSELLSGFHTKVSFAMIKHLLLRILICFPFLFSCGYSLAAEQNFIIVDGATNELVLDLGLNTSECISLDAKLKMDYWNIQRKGANYFNQIPSNNWFVAAKEIGVQFARLAPDKWKSDCRDFLIGDADDFKKIPGRDFETLKTILDQAQHNNIKIVLTLLSLPGSRWKQNNQEVDDLRIWKHQNFRKQAILFWKELAKLLKDHPAVVGYNILNEPHPELIYGICDYRQIDFLEFEKSVRGSLADLNLFYQEIISAIREVDFYTPIIVDTGMYATPWAISYLTPIEDDKVIYSFHMYEPYAYTTRKINGGRFAYPGAVPLRLDDVEDDNSKVASISIDWNKKTLEEFLKPIFKWQKMYGIPVSQILVGEFGCDRTAKGAEKYLSDLLDIFDAYGWHWAFYSFREDCWDSMDYELGSGKLKWDYWDAVDRGESLDKFRHDNPLFDVIKNKLIRSIGNKNG